MEWQIKTTVLSAQSDLTIVVGPEWRESKCNVARPKPSHQQCLSENPLDHPEDPRGICSSYCNNFCLMDLELVYSNIMINSLFKYIHWQLSDSLNPLRDPQGIPGPPEGPPHCVLKRVLHGHFLGIKMTQ